MHEEFAYYSPYENMFRLTPEDIKPFNVQLAGMAFCDETYIIYRPDSPIWCFEYIIEGKGYLTQDSEHFIARKGDVYILRKNATHYYYSDADDPWIKIFFCIYGDLADRMIEGFGMTPLYLIENVCILDLFREFNETAKSSRSIDEMNDRCCIVFLKILQRLRLHISRAAENDSIAARLRREIDNIVDFSVEKSGFDSIIARTGCSKAHAIRVFRAEYSVTQYQYILQKKIALAKMMLTNSFLSVGEITEKLDFCDTHHFSSTFSRMTGDSPTAYRKKFRPQVPPEMKQ